jgi:hypothetical protein
VRPIEFRVVTFYALDLFFFSVIFIFDGFICSDYFADFSL